MNFPFPQNCDYGKHCVKPSVSNSEMNQAVLGYYKYWVKTYLKESNGTTQGGGFYVEMQGTGGTGTEKTTSEAHGYGMIITVLMAGERSIDSKMYFDGLFNMFKQHPSTENKYLMSWLIDESEDREKDENCATDGDMDIAYALLLAHTQWGSDGAIDYISEARLILEKGIRVSLFSEKTALPLLGDWDDAEQFHTRSSDWMTGHLLAYYALSKDDFWLRARESIFTVIELIQQNFSPKTGLMPDFAFVPPSIKNPTITDFKPVEEGWFSGAWLEYPTEKDYSSNACRFPWRMITDYVHYGEKSLRVKKILENINNWLINSYEKPSLIPSVFTLEGQPIQKSHFSAHFIAPFVASMMVDKRYQSYLTEGWNFLKNCKSSYYPDSINLMVMLLISGNWFKPEI